MCEERFAAADENLKVEVDECITNLIASDSKFVDIALQTDPKYAAIKLNKQGIVQTVLAIFASRVTHPSELCKIDLSSVPLGEEEEKAVRERRHLEAEIEKIKRAQKGIRDALKVSDDELREMLDALTY
jgi:hypothetical protein